MDFYKDVFKPITDERMADLEKKVGIQLKNFEVYHGAKVPVPLRPDAKPSEFTSNRLKLRMDVGERGERPTATQEVIGWLTPAGEQRQPKIRNQVQRGRGCGPETEEPFCH